MTPPPFLMFHNKLPIVPEVGRWDELHLYTGSRCNRACEFCCVNGEPKGSHVSWTEEGLQQAVRLVATQGSLKFYGGEPTLDTENLIWAMARLRELGFKGIFTLFSNGIRANDLVCALESDKDTLAVLNFAIATGTGEKPLPAASLAVLQEFDTLNPNRVFVSHDFIIPVGRQNGKDTAASSEMYGCFHCFPTLCSDGRLHACPFAVEYNNAHFQLGNFQTEPADALPKLTKFFQWIDNTLEPEAKRQGEHACTLCVAYKA